MVAVVALGGSCHVGARAQPVLPQDGNRSPGSKAGKKALRNGTKWIDCELAVWIGTPFMVGGNVLRAIAPRP